MRRFWRKHQHLVGYLMIVLVAVVAVEIHHQQTTADINRAVRNYCHDAEIVSSNQRIVLTYLIEFNTALGNNANALKAAKARVPKVLC